jgi:hypothetical protein
MKLEKMRYTIASVLPLALLLAPVASWAQSCMSTGADGAYSPTTSGNFDPVALGLNAAGDNVFNFTSVNIPNGVQINMAANLMKSQRPVVFLVSGAVNIQGVLNLSGASGSPSVAQSQFELRAPSEPGPGGYPGGAGGSPNSAGERGAGPGSAAPTSGVTGCSGSYVYLGAGGSGCTPGPVYGNDQLLPLVGGSGGSGGASSSATSTGAGGGAGGGAIRVCSDSSITINQLYANGGNSGANYGGGAGSGGAIHLQSPTVTLNYGGGEYIQAVGGNLPGVGSGSQGRIRIDTNNLIGGATNPAPYVSALLTGPYDGVPLPTPPTLSVVSINGVVVPTQPLDNYSPPDLAINATGTIPIVVKTSGIPNGATATFYIATDDEVSPGATDIVTTATITSNTATPPVGTATLNVTLPEGVNRLFVRAVF